MKFTDWMEEKESMKKVKVTADWKDLPSLVEQLTSQPEDLGVHLSHDNEFVNKLIHLFGEAYKKHGLHFYHDPEYVGTDQYGFIISKKEMNEQKVN